MKQNQGHFTREAAIGSQETGEHANLQHLIDVQEDEYHVRTAKTIEEACKLVEAGFEYVTELEGVKLFRKRK